MLNITTDNTEINAKLASVISDSLNNVNRTIIGYTADLKHADSFYLSVMLDNLIDAVLVTQSITPKLLAQDIVFEIGDNKLVMDIDAGALGKFNQNVATRDIYTEGSALKALVDKGIARDDASKLLMHATRILHSKMKYYILECSGFELMANNALRNHTRIVELYESYWKHNENELLSNIKFEVISKM